MAASLSEQEKRDLRFVFNVYDPKNDGVISADDVIRAMSALGFAQSREVVEVRESAFRYLLFIILLDHLVRKATLQVPVWVWTLTAA